MSHVILYRSIVAAYFFAITFNSSTKIYLEWFIPHVINYKYLIGIDIFSNTLK